LKSIPDNTGRFRLRPHYQSTELDVECEEIITTFMNERCNGFVLPIPTEVLTKLIERDAADLDLYADLSEEEGENVHGVTDFRIGNKPSVRIDRRLSERQNGEHRLRTTLTHEYGHVKFHDELYQSKYSTPALFVDAFEIEPLKCKWETQLDAPSIDWMEWQAGYTCGALLMPASYVRKSVSDFMKRQKLTGPPPTISREALILISGIREEFFVSDEAARIRLLKLGHITDRAVGNLL